MYVDGYVIPVPTRNKDAYRRMAVEIGAAFKEHGALKVVETWGDDVPEGKITSLPMAVKLEADETVVFSWIVWPSKAVRDQGWAAIMKDPRMQTPPDPPVFDGKRMVFGGFEVLVEL